MKFVAGYMPEANEMVVSMMAVVAQAERQMISQPTRAALAATKARDVKLGKPENLRNQMAGARDHCGLSPPNLIHGAFRPHVAVTWSATQVARVEGRDTALVARPYAVRLTEADKVGYHALALFAATKKVRATEAISTVYLILLRVFECESGLTGILLLDLS